MLLVGTVVFFIQVLGPVIRYRLYQTGYEPLELVVWFFVAVAAIVFSVSLWNAVQAGPRYVGAAVYFAAGALVYFALQYGHWMGSLRDFLMKFQW